MNKSAPSFGRIAAMVVFALSCFGLLLFLWLAFGGAGAAEAEGLPLQRVVLRGDAALDRGRRADLRRAGRQGQDDRARQDDRAARIVAIELEPRYAPLPSDARAILRQKTLLGETYVELTPGTPGRAEPVAEGGSLAESQVSDTVQLDEIFRTFDKPTRARRSRSGCRSRRAASAATGATSTTRSATSPRSPRTRRGSSTSSTASRARSRSLISNTGVVFDALSERDGQLRSLIENSNRVFQATASRDEELKQTFIALPTFERESTLTLDRLAEFAQTTNPLITQLRPAARELSPTLQDLGALSPDLRRCSRSSDPLITPRARASRRPSRCCEDARPLIAQLDPAMRQLTPIFAVPRALQARADLVLRQHGRGDAGERRPAAALPAHDEPAQPGEPGRVSAPGRHQPAERRTPSRATSSSCARECPSFENRHCGDGLPAITQRAAAAAAAGRRRPGPARAAQQHHAVRLRWHAAGRRRAAVPPAGQVQLRRRGHAVPARQRER